MLLTPRDTAGEKEVEVFRGAGEQVEPLNFAALEALKPAPVDPAALDGGGGLTLEALVEGRRTGDAADIEAGDRPRAAGLRARRRRGKAG